MRAYTSPLRLQLGTVLALLGFATLAAVLFSQTSMRNALPRLPHLYPTTHIPPIAPVWYNYAAIKAVTLPASNAIAPLLLRHLAELHAPPPYESVYIISAWLDTRPILVDHPPEIALVAQMQGEPFIQPFPGSAYPDCPLQCFVVMRKGGKEQRGTSKAKVAGVPDIHEHEKLYAGVVFNCPLAFDDEPTVDWTGAEIFVTLSLPEIEPPPDVFSPVTHLPLLDPTSHRLGHGDMVVCLAPLVGDIYAPRIREFIAYYRSLGATHFVPYLLDPGPAALRVFRDIARDDGIEPIRWGLPRSMTKSALDRQDSILRNFQVEPRSWAIPGIPSLPDKQEMGLVGTAKGEPDIMMWYFGQSMAQQDCSFRAMASGKRWVAAVDWDEYVFLRPADGHVWPPPATSAGGSAFLEWARSVDHNADSPDTLNEESALQLGVDVGLETAGIVFPSSFTFLSGFACLTFRYPFDLH
ncbi:hypothetical protein RQP46_003812 [Phenoliferia psychrophenolica]